MANNYEQATVEPSLPANLVSPLERALLRGHGFDFENDSGNTLYFFAQESTVEDFYGELDPALVRGDTSRLGKRIQTYLKNEGVDLLTATDIEELPSSVSNWVDIFRGILKKPENRRKNAVKEIVIMAAQTCDKMRPGEFAGWVMRLTPTRIQHESTHGILHSWRKRNQARRKRNA